MNFYYETTHYVLEAPVTWSVHREEEHRELSLKKNEIDQKEGVRNICLAL